MSKLFTRLSDASRSGVYHSAGDAEILDATRGTQFDVVRVDLRQAKSKRALLDAMASALSFPAWFGGNWDALEDCLGDLSWREGEGRVLLIESAGKVRGDDLGVLRDILESSAAYWSERGKPFFAVFLGERNSLDLPALIRPGA